MELSPGLHLRPDLLADGYSDKELQRLRRAGTMTSVRRGGLVHCDDERLRAPTRRHALLIYSTVPRLAPGAVLSHISAAVLHGLRVWKVPLGRVHVTRDARGGGRSTGKLVLHAAALGSDDVIELGGLEVTSVARTVVDLARTLPFEQAVVLADGALAMGLVTREELVATLQRLARRRGARAARRVVVFADGRSESVGESRSRVAIARVGLPAPVLQWDVRRADGSLVGRTDFGWPERATVGEFDGRVKYGRLLRPGQEPGDAVYEEKLREDELRAQTLSVVRWTWGDLDRFEPVAARLRQRFGPP